ncbi:MAG: hypothetical protein J5759_04190 [Bacteroidales bacterium]|nr:hypothetical protein [Bacteroidales bacterium]
MLSIGNNGLKLLMHEPQDGFYLGTRFDRSGVFGSVLWHGTEMAGRWFTAYNPEMHDAVCGPAEEFSPIGYDDAAPGGTFVKIGVGLLRRPDAAPYDRFRLYPIADPGTWTAEAGESSIVFTHRLDGIYLYRKEILLTGPASFAIRHRLESLGAPLSGEVYNHNFWTFGRFEVGPARLLDFPFRPDGAWRAQYDSVAFTPSGIRFSRTLQPGESVYTGNIHEAGTSGMPYAMSVSDGPVSVRIRGNVPVTHTVLWSNHRIACLEPYNDFATPFDWEINYLFSIC